MQRILCPVDFSDDSVHAAEHAAAVARYYDGRVVLLHVRPTVASPPALPAPDAGGAHGPSAAEIEELRDRAASILPADAGVLVEVSVVTGRPVGAIVEQARAIPAELIVMGTHGTGGFRHLVLGSVTEKVLRQAPCPVLTIPHRAETRSANPYRHVLCALDLTDGSVAIAAAAASLARKAGARLTLLHVLDWPWHEPPLPTGGGVPPEMSKAILEYRHYLESSATERLETLTADLAGVPVTARRVRFGKPYIELLAEAAEGHADVIVLGVHGRTALDIGLFGSTANHVVRQASCPVLTVPA